MLWSNCARLHKKLSARINTCFHSSVSSLQATRHIEAPAIAAGAFRFRGVKIFVVFRTLKVHNATHGKHKGCSPKPERKTND